MELFRRISRTRRVLHNCELFYSIEFDLDTKEVYEALDNNRPPMSEGELQALVEIDPQTIRECLKVLEDYRLVRLYRW